MKKILLALLVAVGCFAANADGDWRTTLGKVKDLSSDTGLAGFGKKFAPAYITGDFDESERPAKKPSSANRNG